MRKFPVIVALVLIVVGGAYALVANLLPDNNQFPRIPTGDGTIGGTIARILGITDLANYLGDGTVANTSMLSGVTADKLLKGNTCANMTDVWLSTDASGTPVCGSNGGMLATTIGTAPTITCAVTAYHANGTSEILASGTGILEGDIIQTAPTCSVTITFADLSIIRIDGGSTVSLDTGVTTSGQTIAYAILNNGGLWGRVLTETGGYYIGNNDIVAGVRGTSVDVTGGSYHTSIDSSTRPTWSGSVHRWIPQNTMMGMTNLNVIHSLYPTTSMNCISFSGITTFSGITRRQEHISGTTHTAGGDWICNNMKTQAENAGNIAMIQSVADIYQWYPRIANNTTADLNYMVQLLKNGGLTPSKATRIQNEINVTKPTTILEKDEICPDEAGGSIKRVYWDIFSGSTIGPCQSALAIADYTIGSANMYFSGGEAVSPGISTGILSAGSWIFDDGFFGGRDCDDGSDTIEAAGSKGSPQNILGQSETVFSSFMSKNNISGSYNQFYLSNNFPLVCEGFSSPSTQWDKFKYAGILYGIKNQNIIPSATGILITGTGYISYPLPLFPSRVGNLAGKKVTIEYNGTPTLYKSIFLGNSSGGFAVFWSGTAWTSSNNTNIEVLPSPSTSVSFKIKTAPTMFLIGNTYPNPTNPIGVTIKSITISN